MSAGQYTGRLTCNLCACCISVLCIGSKCVYIYIYIYIYIYKVSQQMIIPDQLSMWMCGASYPGLPLLILCILLCIVQQKLLICLYYNFFNKKNKLSRQTFIYMIPSVSKHYTFKFNYAVYSEYLTSCGRFVPQAPCHLQTWRVIPPYLRTNIWVCISWIIQYSKYIHSTSANFVFIFNQLTLGFSFSLWGCCVCFCPFCCFFAWVSFAKCISSISSIAFSWKHDIQLWEHFLIQF